MIDLKDMQVAFLLQWVLQVCKANNPYKWSLTPRVLFSCFESNFECFHANVNSCKFKGLNLVKSYFWCTVLVNRLDNNLPNCKDRIITLLRNNEHVSCSGEVLYFKEWAVNGILFVTDFVTPEGLLSFQEICEIVGNSPNRILEYNAMYSLVSTFLRRADDTVATLEQPMFYSKKIRRARDLRQHLVNRKSLELCAKGFWNRKYSVDLDKNFWSIAFRATKETRLCALHWKILHNIYPTNKMKVKENNKCTYCTELVDYIEHFFFEGPVVRDFWQHIEQHILILL